MSLLKELAMKYPWLVALVTLLLGVFAWRYARGQEAEVKVGDPAPAFSLRGSDGKTHSLADLKGRTVVVAWFPKAFTGG